MNLDGHISWKDQAPDEVLVDQRHRVRRAHPRITGQASQHGVGLDQGMPTQTQGPTSRPLLDRPVRLVRSHEERNGHAGVDSPARSVCHRRPESISANTCSSVTTVSA